MRWPFARGAGVRHRGAALDELAQALLVQEHSSLREEILASYGYAQSIVRWTLATAAAIVAAGLVAIHDSTESSNNPILVNVVLFVFGFGIPAVAWLNASTWLGELYRAERAGSYLRAVEADIAAVPGLADRLGFEPVRWERFIWSNRRERSLWGKQIITYLGTAGTFSGCAIGGFIILWISVVRLSDVHVLHPEGLSPLWVVASFLFNVGCAFVCFMIYARLIRLGDAVAPVRARGVGGEA